MFRKFLLLVFAANLAASPLKAQTGPRKQFSNTFDILPVKISKTVFLLSVQTENDTYSPVARQAIEQLVATMDEIRDLPSLYDALPLAESIVEKLVKYRPEKCRDFMLKLFERVEKEIKDTSDSTPTRTLNKRYIRDVIRIAGKVDSEMAAKFIERLSADEKNKPIANKSDLTLSFAKDLTSTNPEEAVRFAERSLGEEVTYHALEFIRILRAKDPKLASKYFAELLVNLSSREFVSVNELFYISSYVFLEKNPPSYQSGRLVTLQNVDGGNVLGTHIDSAEARQYLQTAIKILLKPDRHLQWQKNSAGGADSDLIFINTVMLPSAKEHLPSIINPLLERQSTLSAMLDSSAQLAVESSSQKYNTRHIKLESNLQNMDDILSEAGKESTPQSRKDQLYYEAAHLAVAEREFKRALELTEKIINKAARLFARGSVFIDIVQTEISNKKYEDAIRWAHEDTDLVRKAYSLTSVAYQLAAKPEKPQHIQQATDLLSEVAEIASALTSEAERVSVLGGISSAFSLYDKGNALLYLRESIRAVNKLDKFNGDTSLTRNLMINGKTYFSILYRKDLSLSNGLAHLAKGDFSEALVIAKEIEDKTFRAKAVVTLCESVMQQTESLKDGQANQN
jgi:tetratricopeptide (TPR) repeat protein